MPSVIASIPDELDEFVDFLVEEKNYESRSDAARYLMMVGAKEAWQQPVSEWDS